MARTATVTLESQIGKLKGSEIRTKLKALGQDPTGKNKEAMVPILFELATQAGVTSDTFQAWWDGKPAGATPPPPPPPAPTSLPPVPVNVNIPAVPGTPPPPPGEYAVQVAGVESKPDGSIEITTTPIEASVVFCPRCHNQGDKTVLNRIALPEEIICPLCGYNFEKPYERPATTRRPAPLHPSQLDHLSASSFELFLTCPSRWAEFYLWGEPREESGEYALIGTAHHAISELYCKTGEIDSALAHPAMADVPAGERDSVRKYLDKLTPILPRIQGVEETLRVKFHPDAPPILMRLDVRYLGYDGVMVVHDHKSNRQYEGAEVWRKKPQGRIYPWAMHRLGWDCNGRSRMSIGYTNIDVQFPDFETWGQEVAETQAWMEDIYRQMVAYYDYIVAHPGEQYMAHTNQYCASCSFRERCDAYQKEFGDLKAFGESLKATMSQPSSPELLKVLQNHQKVINKLVEEAAAQVRSSLLQIEGHRSGYGNGGEVYLDYGDSRKLSFTRFWGVMFNLILEHGPEFFDGFLAQADDILSVRMGGLDKFLEMNPGIKEALEPLIERVPDKTPQIKFIAGK